MTGQSEIEINRKLLAEAEQAFKNEQARLKNVNDSLAEMRSKVIVMMDRGHWDDAQTALLQAKVLSIKHETAVSDVKNAEGRVATLRAALTREEERQARVPAYIPYQPSPKTETIPPETISPKSDASKAEAPRPETPKAEPYAPELRAGG